MKTLSITTQTMQYDKVFTMDIGAKHGYIEVSLYKDYITEGDGILWGLQRSVCLSSTYSKKQVEQRERLNNLETVKDSEIVLIEGKQYKTRVLGDFSNCAIFDPVDTI